MQTYIHTGAWTRTMPARLLPLSVSVSVAHTHPRTPTTQHTHTHTQTHTHTHTQGLRKRITRAFLDLIRDPAYNPESRNLVNPVPL